MGSRHPLANVEPLECRRVLSAAASVPAPAYSLVNPQSARQMEMLNRGLVAIRTGGTSVFLSWRLLGTDPSNIGFNLYRSANGGAATKLNGSVLAAGTNFTDSTANLALPNGYFVKPVINGVEQQASETFTLAANTPIQDYLNLPLQIPAGGTTPDGGTYTYSANDASVGDVDGDGQYEIFVKWDPSDSHDSSQDGFTGNTYLDCYKLDGTRLWRIDEGRNIRAGAHYTQFIVYDLDGDGKAEVALKTAPGTIDGQGNPVLLAGDNVTDDYRNATTGRINSGSEYLTIFNGQSGAAMTTVPFKPDRINTSSWGDDYGNRQDRILMAVAYLDGQRPSLVVGRGIFPGQTSGHAVRNEVTAWDWRNGQLSMRWWFRADKNASAFGLADANTAYVGQGNYEMQPADVDGDGRDEIVYGSMTIDDNGQPLYSTGLGHGDALHVSDMVPGNPGLEIYMPMESPGSNGHITTNVHDGATGSILWDTFTRAGDADPDVGRGNAFDIDPNYPGYEVWDSYNADIYNAATNADIYPKPSNMFINFGVWWDGDPLRELLDGTTISDFNYTTHGRSNFDLDPATSGTQGFAPNAASNNGTKSTPCLSGDILGDWREEVVWRRADNTALEIFTSPIATSTRYYTLMHDPQYREAIAWQNVGYNQPPQPGFFLGAADASGTPSVAPTPNLYYAGSGTSGLPPNTYQAELASFGGGSIVETTNAGYDASGYINFPSSGGFDQFNNVNGGGGGAGVKTLNIRYANGGGAPRTGVLIVNGVSQPITFPSTGGFASWEVLSVNIPLAAGATNTIRFESNGSDLANIDEISVDLGPETGSISGRVFHDSNDDGAFAAEPTLAGVTVYLDTNNDGVLDAGEISATSDGSGNYSFTSLPNGTFAVREIVPANYFASNSIAPKVTGGAAVAAANLANELIVYTGAGGGDTYAVQKNAGGQYVISIAGGATYIVSPAAPSLAFNLLGGADVLTIDATGAGGTPIPAGGVTFDGGSASSDTLIINGAAAVADTAAFDGSAVTLNGGVISEANVESAQFDGNGGWDNVTINGGPTLTFPDAQRLDNLALMGTASASLAAGGAANVITRSLSIAPTARLDLCDNDMAIDYVSSSPLGTWNGSAYTGVSGLIASGYAGGAWSGGGIVTSMTAAIDPNSLTTLGVAEASQALGIGLTETALWDGQTIDGTAVLVKYTYAGDANLDGVINGDDYFQIDSAFPQGGNGWLNGDFNCDGVINGDDYFLIDSNFPAQGAPL